jgi:hypothetical protein
LKIHEQIHVKFFPHPGNIFFLRSELERKPSLLDQVQAAKQRSKESSRNLLKKMGSRSQLDLEEEPGEEENPEAPSFSRFKVAFDNLLQDGDFSKTKKEEITKLPNNQKWEMLKQYKSSTLDMLVKFSRQNSTQKNISFFPPTLGNIFFSQQILIFLVSPKKGNVTQTYQKIGSTRLCFTSQRLEESLRQRYTSPAHSIT